MTVQKNDKPISKSLHSINTVMHYQGESTLIGKDEWGCAFTLTIPTIELLEWLDYESRQQMAKTEIERIQNLAE